VIRWVDVGQEAQGVIAIGQQATGIIAIGQLATGVIAVGQLARGVVVLGQLAVGIVSVGQLALGVVWTAAMLGVGGTSPGWAVLRAFRAPPAQPVVVATAAGQVGSPLVRRLPPRWPLSVLAIGVLAVAWWHGAGADLVMAVLGDDGILHQARQPR
jgi:hypothetical protein